MLLLIYSARKRSDCVFGVLFECPVDLFPFRFFSLTVLFLNSFMLLRVFPLRARLFFSFRDGLFRCSQEQVMLLNSGMR